jgi:tetratricopeptide (TPR) repeat protein
VSASRTTRWALLAILAAGALTYANSLNSPFVLDDEDAIVRNPYITSLTPLSAAMSAPAQSSFAGRPIAALSLAISYAGGGLTPASFRSWNIGVLIASALVLFGIVRRTIRRATGLSPTAESLALATALLWLVHPLNSEVVGYVTQRTESMMGFFYLLTLYSAIRAIDAPKRMWRWTIAAVAACIAGMACKESMVTAPVMVLLYDVVFGGGSLRDALKRRTGLHAGLAATWLVLLLLNLDGPRAGSAGFGTAVPASTYLLNQAGMITAYLALAVWPHPLVLDYGRTQPIAWSDALPYVVIVGLLLAAVAWSWLRGHRVLAFLGTWFFVTLAPTSSIVPIATEVGAERRMYLPLIAIGIIAVISLHKALRSTRALAGVIAVMVVVLGGLTIARNAEYRDPVGIWQGVVDRRPHGRAHYNLGIALTAAGRGDEALAHYQQAAATEPAAYYALGFEAAQAGRLDESVAAIQEFLRLRPADPMSAQAALLLGESLTRLNRPADAEQAFRTALELAPAFADAQGKLADVLLAQGRSADAIAAYRSYLASTPDSASAHHGLGLALATIGQEQVAAREFERAVALNPGEAQFRMSLGTALAATGRIDDAITQYREGLRLAPANAGMMSALAVALADRGDRDESLALFRRALQIAPNDPAIQADFQTALALIRQK